MVLKSSFSRLDAMGMLDTDKENVLPDKRAKSSTEDSELRASEYSTSTAREKLSQLVILNGKKRALKSKINSSNDRQYNLSRSNNPGINTILNGRPDLLTKNNKRSSRSRVLRYGETIESLFCVDTVNASSTDEVQLCKEISFGDKSDDAASWCKVLKNALSRANNAGDGANLIRLHRRAIGRRFETEVKRLSPQLDGQEQNATKSSSDVLQIWLSYACVQSQYGLRSEARQTYRQIQNARGEHDALLYLAWANFERYDDSVNAKDKAENVLRKGIEKGAKPLKDLHFAMKKLRDDEEETVVKQSEAKKVTSETVTVSDWRSSSTRRRAIGVNANSDHNNGSDQIKHFQGTNNQSPRDSLRKSALSKHVAVTKSIPSLGIPRLQIGSLRRHKYRENDTKKEDIETRNKSPMIDSDQKSIADENNPKFMENTQKIGKMERSQRSSSPNKIKAPFSLRPSGNGKAATETEKVSPKSSSVNQPDSDENITVLSHKRPLHATTRSFLQPPEEMIHDDPHESPHKKKARGRKIRHAPA